MPARPHVSLVPMLAAALLAIAIASALTGAPANATVSGAPASSPSPTDSPSPATDTITIKSPVTVTALGGAGGDQLAVTADSTTPLASMTVHLLATGTGSGSGADGLDLAMTAPSGGAQAGTSTWTSPAITQPTLPLGSYYVTVDAADQGGATVTGAPAGTFHFQNTPRIAPAAGNYVISGSNQHPVIEGTATELAPGAAKPTAYANQPIILDDPITGNVALTTNSTGAYRVALRKPVPGETITAEIAPTATTQAAKATPVALTVRTAITGFAATLNPVWQLTVRGCLGLTAGTPGTAPSPAGLIITYSAGPRGPWHPLGPVTGRPGAACGDHGRSFTAVLTAKLSGAYYRASYPVTAARRAATGDLPSASAVVHAWKYVTRITHFAVSKRTVTSGGRLTTSGRLQYEAGGRWHDLPHKVVQIILLPSGSRVWYWIARVTTNAAGYFTATFVDPVTATWSAEYLGDQAHLAAVGAVIGVTLKG